MIDQLIHDRRAFLAGIGALATLPRAVRAAGPGGRHAAIRRLMEAYVGGGKVANMVVAIGGRRGPPDFLALGRQDIDAPPLATPDTLYRLHSMTKPITGCAIMLLIEDGKLKLDTPLAEIFPAYRQMQVLVDPKQGLETRPAVKPITIRHLVTHSAGFTYDSSAPAPLKPLYATNDLALWHRWEPGKEPKGPAGLMAYAEAAASLPLLFEPGAKFQYSIGLDIAGAVVEKVSGMPFEAFLRKRIFDPVGMADTFFTVPSSKLDRLTPSYRHTDQGFVLFEAVKGSPYTRTPSAASGGGGLISSTRDYARFMAMLLGEGRLGNARVMKAETARSMMSDLMEPGIVATTEIGDFGYGAGGRVVVKPTPEGEGLGTYGWSGAANTVAFVDRANGVYVVLMTQIRQWWTNTIYKDLGQALYTDIVT